MLWYWIVHSFYSSIFTLSTNENRLYFQQKKPQTIYLFYKDISIRCRTSWTSTVINTRWKKTFLKVYKNPKFYTRHSTYLILCNISNNKWSWHLIFNEFSYLSNKIMWNPYNFEINCSSSCIIRFLNDFPELLNFLRWSFMILKRPDHTVCNPHVWLDSRVLP